MKFKALCKEHFVLEKRHWLAKAGVAALIIVIACFLLYIFGGLYDRPAENEYLVYTEPSGYTAPLHEGDVLEQSFVSPFDTLRIISVLPDSAAADVNIMYVVRLYENGELLRTTDFKTQDTDGAFNLCELPITGALGKTYRVEITLGRTTEDKAVPFALMPSQDAFENATLNGEGLSAPLAINLNAAPSGQADTYKVVLFLLSAMLIVAICLLGKKAEINAAVLMLLFGAFMAVLNPIGDSPDEYAHYLRAEAVSQGRIFASSEDLITADDAIHALFIDADYSKYKFDKFSDAHLYAIKSSGDTITTTAGTSGNYIFTAYLGSALGLTIGKGLHLPAMLVVYLCRLINVLIYTAICTLAVSLVPKMKMTFAFLTCFPFCVYLSASFNSDLLTFALAFLLTAYFLRLWCAPDGTVGARQLAVYSVLAMLLALTKIPYLIFYALLLLLPRARYKKGRNVWWTLGFLAATGIVCLVWLALSGAAGLRPAAGADAGQQLLFMLQNPGRAIRAVLGTIFEESLLMYQHWFTLGWLYYNFAYVGLIIPFVFYNIVTSEMLTPREVLGKPQKALAAACGVGAVLLTYLAMYISTMAVGSANVVGIQGRYLVPCLALLPLALAKPNENPQRAMQPYTAAYWSAGFLTVCVCNIMLRHYM